MVALLVAVAIVVGLGAWTSVTVATAEVAGVCSACFLHEPRQHHQVDHQQRQMLDTLQPLARRETGRGSVSKPEPTMRQQDIEDIARHYGPPTGTK
jgi:hypothetical protein